MAGSVLTPISIWGDFYIDKMPVVEIIDKREINGYTFLRFYVEGRKTPTDCVKIFCTSVCKGTPKSAVLVIPDLEGGIDEELLLRLAQEGYYVLSMDVSGKTDGADYFTVYPDCIDFANYSIAKDQLFSISKDVYGTCWYEWDCAVKYAMEYLNKNLGYQTFAGIGISKGASILWHTSLNEKRLACICAVEGAGWETYSGYSKFDDVVPSDFTDEQVKYMAGLEAQAYAQYVKCPVLMLSPTNSKEYDCDRAFDTVSRVKDVYSVANYSVNIPNGIDLDGFKDLLLFLGGFLGNKKINFPKHPEIFCEYEDGQIAVSVEVDVKDIVKVEVFSAEETQKSSERAWSVAFTQEEDIADKFTFNYTPYGLSKEAFFFARAEYKNGFKVCSYIVCKKFDEFDEGLVKSKVLYSGMYPNTLSYFAPVLKENKSKIDYNGESCIKALKGPMGIVGLTCDNGLVTYKINAVKDKPNDDAILVFDAYVKQDANFTVSVVCLQKDKSYVEYFYSVNLIGEEIWHNVKVELNKFKSQDGLPLKSYENAICLKFNADCEFLLTNALFL